MAIQSSTFKNNLSFFYPVYKPDDKLNFIYRMCFKITFVAVFVLGFAYYFFLGPDVLPSSHNHALGYVIWIALGAAVTMFLFNERYVPKNMYQNNKGLIGDCLMMMFMWVPGYLDFKIDKFLLDHNGITFENVLLLVIYAYGSAVLSIAIARLLITFRYTLNGRQK